MHQEPEIDWSLTTWEGVRRAQLRRNLRLTVTERFQALHELAKLSRQLAQIGKRSAAVTSASRREAPED